MYSIGRLIAVLFIVMIGLNSCKNDNKLTLDMEAYYNVFDGVFEDISIIRRARIRVDSSLLKGVAPGDDVTMLLRQEQGRLVVKEVTHLKTSRDVGVGYYLDGFYINKDEVTGEGTIRFTFRVTRSESTASEYSERKTKLIRVYFKAEKDILAFEHLEVIGVLDRPPVMTK